MNMTELVKRFVVLLFIHLRYSLGRFETLINVGKVITGTLPRSQMIIPGGFPIFTVVNENLKNLTIEKATTFHG
jgi:hypothetical protein